MSAVNFALSLQVQGGPQISVANPVTVEAYDLTKIALDPDSAEHQVQIQPGGAASVSVLLIKSSRYAPEITYKVSDGSADSAELKLTQPHCYTAGMIDLFKVDPPTTLKFKNALANTPVNKIEIEVFVGRDATP